MQDATLRPRQHGDAADPRLTVGLANGRAAEAKRRWGLRKVAMVHRVGLVPVGEPSVAIAVSAGHREEAGAARHRRLFEAGAEVAARHRAVFAEAPEHGVEDGDRLGADGRAAQALARLRARLAEAVAAAVGRIGERIDGVTPTSLRVKVDLLAVNERAVAATAHVKLTFRTSGNVTSRVSVQGELRLTKRDGKWKIFAYDLTKGAR